jgi:hypothetical protein
MSEERRKVLEMLAAGKITAEDADRLLEKLASRGGGASSPSEPLKTAGDVARVVPVGSPTSFVLVTDPPAAPSARRPLRFLRIIVNSKSQDTVNIRVPLAFVRTGLKLTSMVPAKVQGRLHEEGIDLSGLSALKGEELIEALRELKVDVDSPDGDTVRIFCE